ncbi:MAG: hypothetical protein CGW95_15415 [Phenylobacterium zucineum]|nr:MAG: hypothetical protein CGW95_15415 [Phenylobacterium zucineum]
MRTLGPGSISSLLKIILDVVYVALWIGVGAVSLITLGAVLLSFNPDLLGEFTMNMNGDKLVRQWPSVIGALFTAALYLAGILVIVSRLRRIFATLMAGDPFHPENVARLRIIGMALAALELIRYAFWIFSIWVIPGATKVQPTLSTTPWFSVLVVFVLAEVFREGARLRREAELTI